MLTTNQNVVDVQVHTSNAYFMSPYIPFVNCHPVFITSGVCCEFFQSLDFTSALITYEKMPHQREEIPM